MNTKLRMLAAVLLFFMLAALPVWMAYEATRCVTTTSTGVTNSLGAGALKIAETSRDVARIMKDIAGSIDQLPEGSKQLLTFVLCVETEEGRVQVLQALKDGDERTRLNACLAVMAAFNSQKKEFPWPEAVPALREALFDEEQSVREMAVVGIIVAGRSSRDALARLEIDPVMKSVSSPRARDAMREILLELSADTDLDLSEAACDALEIVESFGPAAGDR